MLESLGQYRILDRLGAGGIGEAYRARDTRLGRTVALKIAGAVIAGDTARRQAFLADARAASALSHPNLAALYDVGEDQGHLFLALEFVPGELLPTVMAGHPLNPKRALDLAAQLGDALAEAHAAGIVHRDVRPANIIVTPKGNAKLLECGLDAWTAGGAARRQAGSSGEAPTAVIGYMSPEQALGAAGDERTDVFSLGVVLYEMLTGKLPFRAANAADLTVRIVQSRPAAPTTLNPTLPRDVDNIIERALAKSLDQRYESVATLAAELRAVSAMLETRVAAADPAIMRPASARKSRVGLWLVLAALVAGLAAAGWTARDTLLRLWTSSAPGQK